MVMRVRAASQSVRESAKCKSFLLTPGQTMKTATGSAHFPVVRAVLWQHRRTETAEPFVPVLCAPHVKAAPLMMVSPDDEMEGSVPAVSRLAYESLSGPKEWYGIGGGYFGLICIRASCSTRQSGYRPNFC